MLLSTRYSQNLQLHLVISVFAFKLELKQATRVESVEFITANSGYLNGSVMVLLVKLLIDDKNLFN